MPSGRPFVVAGVDLAGSPRRATGLCILLIGVYYIADGDKSSLAQINPVFWLEAIAVAAFGISWLIKGEAILKDETS